MLFHNLARAADFRIAMAPVVAGTSNQNGTAIDTLGFDGICFVVSYGALTANQVTQAKAQQGALSNGSDASDIANSHTTLLTDGQSNTLQVIDIYRPTNRYVRPVVLRGTANAVINGIIAILYHTETAPPVLPADQASAPVVLNQPALGTA
jgi:hypothetical protein